MPKVSVVVPVYNPGNGLRRCVNALFAQTLRDVEYVFVEDCSTDNSRSLLHELVDGDSRCRVLENRQNMGCPWTRRRGIEATTGEYVISCDDDDWTEPEWLETMYAAAKRYDLDIVWSDFYKNEGGEWHVIAQPASNDSVIGDGKELPSVEGEIRSLLLARLQAANWNHLVRHSLYGGVKEWPVASMAEDFPLIIQLYALSKRVGRVAKPLNHYDYSDTSMSNVTASTDKTSNANADKKLIRQALDMEEHVRLLERFFQSRGEEGKYHGELVFRKYFNKRWMQPAIHSAGGCRTWRNIHPEINASLFRSPYISLKDKATALACMTNTYPLIKRIRH